MADFTIVGGRGHIARPEGDRSARPRIVLAHANTPCEQCNGIALTSAYTVTEPSGLVYVFCSLFCKITYRELHGKALLPEWQ